MGEWGPLFHYIIHEVIISWYISEEQGVKNRNEFVRVCNIVSPRNWKNIYYHGNRIVVIGRNWENWFVNCGLFRQRTAIFLLKGKVVIQIQLKLDYEWNLLM